ncbi:MAG: exosortase VPDSG-CTERM-specific [Chthoniobacteraceae bacterium]|nr:exosortase VPDSG-CTERM-specific [Chthoniobacteraceae bacterium]
MNDENSEVNNGEAAEMSRLRFCLIFSLLVLLVYIKPLISLAMHAAAVDLHSQILLVPFISAYLVYIQRDQIPSKYVPFPGAVIAASFSGLVALFLAYGGILSVLSENDYLGLMMLSFLSFLTAGGFYFLGRKWMAAVAFPIAFLIFMVPLPDALVESLETGSKLGSAEVANWFFQLTGTPVLRDRTVFQLPGIVIEVAQECSGIRSSWVLFITSLLASYMFLKGPWRRTVLVLLVIPLGLIRNGFRILVIGLLCVHIGPHMIHHMIHRKGGPFFFVLSLIPLFLLLWWLRRGEVRKE